MPILLCVVNVMNPLINAMLHTNLELKYNLYRQLNNFLQFLSHVVQFRTVVGILESHENFLELKYLGYICSCLKKASIFYDRFESTAANNHFTTLYLLTIRIN